MVVYAFHPSTWEVEAGIRAITGNKMSWSKAWAAGDCLSKSASQPANQRSNEPSGLSGRSRSQVRIQPEEAGDPGLVSPLHGSADVGHPDVPVLFGAGIDLVHLWPLHGGADQKHGLLLVGYLPHDELLQRDDGWL